MTKSELNVISAVVHQLTVGEASDLLALTDGDEDEENFSSYNFADAARDLRWCRDALTELIKPERKKDGHSRKDGR